MELGTMVLITTEHRGVFCGNIIENEKIPQEVTLDNCRCVMYWDQSCKGFLGLAATGPTKECRLGAKVNGFRVFKITSVTPVSDEAKKQWESFV